MIRIVLKTGDIEDAEMTDEGIGESSIVIAFCPDEACTPRTLAVKQLERGSERMINGSDLGTLEVHADNYIKFL